MQRHVRGPKLFVLPVALTLLLLTAVTFQPSVLAAPPAGEASGQTPGSLGIVGKDGKIQATCPLKHTDVRAGISGFLARVTVTQTFANTATQNIEAIYTFPLPQDAAVDDMTIQIGDRTVRGLIKRREEARVQRPQLERRVPGAQDPARRGTLGINAKAYGPRSFECTSQPRFDSGAPHHRLDRPGKGENVAPLTAGQE